MLRTDDPRCATLAALPPGAAATVVAIDGEDVLARRLAGLGFWPGTPVRVVRRAPFGDPLQCELRGYHLALRRVEAIRVRVQPAEATP